jgi:hypothetical protein
MAMVLELEATHAQIQRILQSKAFRTSEIHRTLLSYLAEKSVSGTADGLKEYTVGLDVFAKPDSYDPRQESTVRMHVARLRQKLGEYYRTEGLEDPIFVDLPKGGFKLTFEPREIRAVAPEPILAVAAARWGPKEIGLIAGLVIALSLAVYFGMRLRQVERTNLPLARDWTPELQQLWEPIVSSKRPLIVCLSTPEAGTSEAGTATGAVLLGQFLGMLHKQDVLVTSSDQIAAPEIAMGNVVFLGPVAGNRQMQAMSADRPFVLEPEGIRNMSPKPGEPELFADKPPHDPQDTEESYALISRVPGLYGNGEVLYLAGNRISSITGEVQAFTDAMFAKALVSKMKKPDGSLPRYYQVVLKVRSMDTMPIEVSYVVHRELPVPEQSSSRK